MHRPLSAHGLDVPIQLIPMLYLGVTIVCGVFLPRLEHQYLASFSDSLSVASA